MGYSKEIYLKAIGEIEERRKNAERDADFRKTAFSGIEPRYNDIKRELSQTGEKITSIIIKHENDASDQIEKLKERNISLSEEIRGLLESNGLERDYLIPHYTCQRCSDTGYVDGWQCECLKELMKNMAFSELNKGTPLSKSGFDEFSTELYPADDGNGISPRRIMETIFKNCKWYSDNFTKDSKSLLFTGETGLGKTHLSLAIAGEVIKKGFGVVYGSVQDFMNKIEKEHFGRSSGDEDTLELLSQCDLLILDDLGAEFSTQFTVSSLYYIINTRILSGRPVIISTNLSMAEMEKKYTERIVSRISGNYQLLRFAGNDIRFAKRS